VVTGGSNGLGLEFIKLLVKDAFRVYSYDISDPSDEIRNEFGDSVNWIKKDLSIQGVSEEIFSEIGEEPIDVLINNAGFGTFGKFSDQEWPKQQAMINLHVLTTAHLTHLSVQGMIKRGKGRIMNLASVAAYQPGPLMSQYYATKAYVMSFTEALANELKGTGVTATVLCPGQTQTNFQQTVSASSRETKMSFNIASAPEVAQKGYDAMMAGKVNVIPGAFNNFLAFLNRILPRKTATNIVRNLQEKNREE
ncbi:MAG: SDR family NAD(P)-dependent oxidoreductase, partial [Robiginitalea sp.]